jgi:hypothetical protein
MSSLDQLLQTPPAELVANLKALRDDRASIESKEAILEQLLDVLVQQGGAVAEEVAALGASVAIGPLRNQIVQVLSSKQEEGEAVMVPKDVQEELVARGNRTVTLDNVRVTMKRMADSNELERPRPNDLLFGLPGAMDALPGGRDAFVQALEGSPPQ